MIAIQKVFNSQNPRTLGFRGLNSGILAHFIQYLQANFSIVTTSCIPLKNSVQAIDAMSK